MNYSDIKQVFTSTSSLTMGSYFTTEEQAYLTSQVTTSNFPFGKSKKDVIQISVFAFDGTAITSSYFVPTGTTLDFTKSYYNVFNKYTEYSYSSYQSDMVIVGKETKSVFLDLGDQLTAMAVQEGNYKVGIQLVRDIVGSHADSEQRLLIDTISTSRTEIAVIPYTTKAQSSQVNDEFYAFASGKVLLKDIVDGLISGISKPEIYKIFYDAAAQNKSGADRFMFDYGFKQGVDVVNFLSDLYYGVKKGSRKHDGQYSQNDILGIYDQFANWAYENYNGAETFQTVKDQYYSFVRYIINQELNRITNTKPEDYDQVVEFLSSIYYNRIFFPVVSVVEEAYSGYISGYFKNFINLGDEKLVAILNTKKAQSTEPTQHDRLILKLSEPLSKEVTEGRSIWITNTFASAPILQNVYFYLKPVISLVKLRGPNLLAKFENEGNSTEAVSIEGLIGETGSLYDELLSKLAVKNKESNQRNVDYRYFENFVNFSSADLRIKAYDSKISSLAQLDQNIQDLNAKLTLHPTDEYYLSLKNEADTEYDTIKASFDGYENFLYLNAAWYNQHTTLYNGISSASLYDADNQNSLINNVPAFMLEDDLNNDYIKFVGMIGHYFDNLTTFITQFTEKNDPSSSPNQGVSLDLVHDVLVSLGWDPEISKENLPLLLGSFSKSDFSEDSPLYNKVGNLSENDRNKLIWKRILNSLPFIYKTKGTKASINAVISCFGIPKNLIKIKEYGTIDQSPTSDDKGLYVFEESKYEPMFSGSGEYFQLPWTGSANTVEFDVSFDKKKTSTEGQVFRLLSCENNWVVGVYRERGMEWGKVFLSIGDGTGSISTSMTQKVPLFDGNSYTVMLRKNDLGHPIDYPTEYELLVRRADSGRIVFSASSSLILSGSYNNVFESGSNLYVGNYHQSTSSLNVDPEAFYGTLDEMKVWEIPVDNRSLEGHALHRGGYNYSNPDTMVDKLLVRVSFNQPISLASGSVAFSNLAFRDDFPTIYAENFPVIYGVSEDYPECQIPDTQRFPYQFSIKNVIQAVRVASYGSQAMRSNKIAHVDPTLMTSLSPDSRSTLRASSDMSVDSNKVGVFFSPIDAQNEEILKFFGDYNFGDLIGDPALSYASSYRNFEKFRQIYYDQGFGIVDYQSFMNVVRAYFDKAMFKYISTLVPARSKLVSGILVEPSILERPKLQLKPVVRENIEQNVGAIDSHETIQGTSVQQNTASISISYRGTSILNDVNHRFYADIPEQYGSVVYSDSNGVAYYNDDYYRADVTKVKKAYQIQREMTLPKSQWNYYQKNTNLRGSVDTISSSFYQINLIKLPTVTQHIFTASFINSSPVSTYFSGAISTPLSPLTGPLIAWTSASHQLSGILSGSIQGYKRDDSVTGFSGFITSPMDMTANFYKIQTAVTYSGFFTNSGGNYTFEGNIYFAPILPIASSSQLHITLISSSPTSSIYQELKDKTVSSLSYGLFSGAKEIYYRLQKSLEVVPANRTILNGYFPTHYKYKKQVFSQKEINAFDNVYDQSGIPSPTHTKWKRGSQSKKTTVDVGTGNLNNTEPVERKST